MIKKALRKSTGFEVFQAPVAQIVRCTILIAKGRCSHPLASVPRREVGPLVEHLPVGARRPGNSIPIAFSQDTLPACRDEAAAPGPAGFVA